MERVIKSLWDFCVREKHTFYLLATAAAKSLQSCPTLRPRRRQPTKTPPSLGFSRQEHWSGLPFPSPFYLLKPLLFGFGLRGWSNILTNTIVNAYALNTWHCNVKIYQFSMKKMLPVISVNKWCSAINPSHYSHPMVSPEQTGEKQDAHHLPVNCCSHPRWCNRGD